jgi:hypothetical protein
MPGWRALMIYEVIYLWKLQLKTYSNEKTIYANLVHSVCTLVH